MSNSRGDSGVAGYEGFGELVQSRWSTGFRSGRFDDGGGFAVGFHLLHGVAQGYSYGGGVELHLGEGRASMAVLFSCGSRLHMSASSCGFEMLLLGLLRLCVGLGFCYGLWVFIFYVYVLMDGETATSSG